MLCPNCGTEAPDDLPECINCGQVFLQAVPEELVVPEGEVLPEEFGLLSEGPPEPEVLLREVPPEPEPLLPELPPEDEVVLREVPSEPEETLEGLERTRFEPAPPSGIDPIPGLESTAIADDAFPARDEPLPGI